MKDTNICKFPPALAAESLTVSCFVLEANSKTMEQSTLLHTHQMILVCQGSGIFYFDGIPLPLATGSLAVGFKGETFRVEDCNDCHYLYIRFEGSRTVELFRRFDIHKDRRSFDGFGGIIPLWQESLSRADGNSVDLAAESMLLYAFSRLPRNNTLQDSLITSILEMTEEAFRDPDLTLAEIAQSLNYSAKYLSHYFKKKMGVGYSAYLKTMRIKYAVTLLEQGITSVKNVALLSGFSDPLYFSSVFKNALGVSPSEYKVQPQGGIAK